MLAAPLWLASNWRSIAMLVVVGVLGAAVLWYRGEAAVAELETAKARNDLSEMTGAYNLLSQSVQRQNEAVQDMERKAAEAARKAAQARSEAAGAVDVATRSAESLARVMAGARPVSECPTKDAVGVVREDLAR